MTSKLIVNSLAADTGVSTITFADQAKMGNAIFHSTGFTIGDSFLHSTGVNITNINATGVITATKFVGEVSVGSSITFEDNEKAYFGTGTDFSIYHNGSASYLDETGTGGLIAKTNTAFQVFNSAGSQPAFTVTPGGSVDLYHNTSKVLETKAYGIDITGGFVATGDCSIADKITHAGDLNTAIRFPAADTFSIETGGNEAFNITYNRIGLNGTIPTASHANVTSSIHLADSNTILSRTGNQYFALFQNLKYTSADAVRYLVNGYASAYAQNAGTHRFYTVGNGTGNTGATVTERLKINNNGLVLVNRDGVGGRIDATAGDASIKISDGNGRSSLKVSDPGSGNSYTWELTSAGNFKAPNGKGIDFSATSDGSGSMQNELLDDYEEGLWTPLVRNSSGTGTAGSANYGYYTKVGNVVHAHATVHWTALNSGTTSTQALLIGFPYATKNAANYRCQHILGAQVVGVQAGGAGYNVSLAFDGNLTYAYILGVNSASTGGSNYTHTPTLNSSGTIYGLSITYLTG